MKKTKQLIATVVLAVVLCISSLVIAPIASKPESYASTIDYLDQKQTTVVALAGSCTTASLVLGAIPGDTTTPIANKLMDMVGYIIVILCTVFMEKCLLSIAGYFAFRWLIPIACIAGIVFFWTRHPFFYRLAFKLAVFGFAVFLVVPLGVKTSQLIEKTNATSIDTAIDNLDSLSETEAETEAADEVETQVSEAVEETEESSDGFWSLINKAKEAVSDAAENAADKASEAATVIANTTEDISGKAQDALNDVMNAIIVMLVTSCLIPILMLYIVWSLVKQIIGIRLDVPDWMMNKIEHRHGHPEMED